MYLSQSEVSQFRRGPFSALTTVTAVSWDAPRPSKNIQRRSSEVDVNVYLADMYMSHARIDTILPI